MSLMFSNCVPLCGEWLHNRPSHLKVFFCNCVCQDLSLNAPNRAQVMVYNGLYGSKIYANMMMYWLKNLPFYDPGSAQSIMSDIILNL